jgi:dTDP-4-dehydrorhamnose reductase
MNVAITGACGLLGAHVAAALAGRHRVTGFDRHPWWGSRPLEIFRGDLEDAEARGAFLAAARPDVLVHCAALANVDACEERPEYAHFVNGMLAGIIAREAPSGCRIVYITTDGIFMGDRPMSTEADLPCPRTVYGRSKLLGEWETAIAASNHVIVRTNFYGWSAGVKNTFAEWLYGALVAGEEITLFDDFWFTPIYVVDLVERLLRLIDSDHTGIFHLGGGERISKYDFGIKMASAAGLSTSKVRRGSIADAALLAARPRDMSLSSSKSETLIGSPAPDCGAGLARFVADCRRPLHERLSATDKGMPYPSTKAFGVS